MVKRLAIEVLVLLFCTVALSLVRPNVRAVVYLANQKRIIPTILNGLKLLGFAVHAI